MYLRRVLIAFSVLFFSAGLSFAEEQGGEAAPALIRVTPSGEDVPAGREIVLQFNKAMVPIGRMERKAEELPIEITPNLECQWRWLNTTTLSCQLAEKDALKTSTRYTLRFTSPFKTQNGLEIAAPPEHSFITARPEVRYTWFEKWRSPGTPTINVVFNQHVDQSSVKDHLYLKSENGERHAIEVELIPGLAEDRWKVYPQRELPLDSDTQLVVEPGIAAASGGEKGVEDRVVVEFATYPAFTFKGVNCWSQPGKAVQSSTEDGEASEGEEYYGEDFSDEEGKLHPKAIFIPAGADSQQYERCNPMRSVALTFSAPVLKEDLKDGVKIFPDLSGGRKDYDAWENVYSYISYYYPHKKGLLYNVYLPIPLKAYESYKITGEPSLIKDAFSRSLSGTMQGGFLTDNRPPKFHLANQISILEKEVDSHLPVVVTNLKALQIKYEGLTAAGTIGNKELRSKLYDAPNIAYPFPVKVRELLGGVSGAVQGYISAGSKRYKGSSWFFSQVTPFHVHVKAGHFNSLVWVTKFSDGAPVAGAKVSFYRGSLQSLSESKSLGKSALTNKDGIAMLAGLSEIDPELKLINQWNRTEPHMFARIESGGEIALVPLAYDFNVYSDYYPSLQSRYGHIHTWGTTAQGIYRLGDTLQYKVFVRNQDVNRFTAAPSGEYTLKVIDPAGNTVFERKDVKLSEFGSLDGEMEISKSWLVGWYRFVLSASFTKETWEPLQVLVSDFTPSPFKVTVEAGAPSYVAGEKVELESRAVLHSGGPYSDAEVRVTSMLSSSPLRFDNPLLQRFEFSEGEYLDSRRLYQTEERLNSRGQHSTSFRLEDEPAVVFGKLLIESAVRDDRGRYVADSKQLDFHGRERYVGLRHDGWIIEKEKPAIVQAVVAGRNGTLLEGAEVELSFEYEETKAAKVKGAGNAYLTEYSYEWVKEDSCSVKSAKEPVQCSFTPAKAGSYRFVAAVKDRNGREHKSTINRWSVGSGYVVWRSNTGNNLTMLPEKSDYKIGEVARVLVQNPFPGANAIATVERYGVIKSWPLVLSDSSQIVEVPITEEMLPGFYFSLVVMSPRVDKPIENMVDLGKPSFKMGYTKINVNDEAKMLRVEVKADKEVYKPRETVNVVLQTASPEAVEFAIAVLDEAVFDMIQSGSEYFDPYAGFYKLAGLDVKNFNLIKQLVGRQKFERKGANPGGSGGSDLDLRSIFKFVSYWNPSVKADKEGRATISFQLPDNLTGWRVLAMAATATDRMGLGEGNFKVNQPTEIRPALPNQVVEGDSFDAKFTVMNRTEETRKLAVELKAQGDPLSESAVRMVEIEIAPFKRETVSLPLATSKDGVIDFTVSAGDTFDRDALKSTLNVHKLKALESAASYATTTESEAGETFQIPSEIRSDVGTIGVVASSSVLGGMDKSFEYIRSYPYSCWEQKLTKAVMASHYLALQAYLPKDFRWEGAKKLLEQTLKEAESFQAPNGGMCFYTARDEYGNHYLSAYTALAFSWLKESGYQIPQRVEERLDNFLLELLRKDVMPDFYSKGMASSVRAVALAALAPRGKVTLSDLQRFYPHIKQMDLFGRANFLTALSHVSGTSEMQQKVSEMLLASTNETGGKIIFTEELDSGFARLLHSVPRTSCTAVSALLNQRKNASKTNSAQTLPSDTYFKLIRPITDYRKAKGRWENTQENVFCLNTFINYSREFENQAPNFKLSAFLDGESLGEGKFTSFRAEPLQLERDIRPSDLGQEIRLKLEKSGSGRVYYSGRLTYSPQTLKAEPINSGMELRREYSVERGGEWKLLERPFKIKVGELVKVDLYLSLPAARNYVVVDDPVPGGLEPVNRDLATASVVDARKGDYKPTFGSFWFRHDDWVQFGIALWGFYHQELRHEAVRYYSEYLAPANYHLSYTAQAIAPGRFSVLPAHAEEMYDPDIFGQSTPEELWVE
ncbi:MAG: large extracellular alpha-helical protein [Deltaproteobacteria bacterium]|nr:large extracellular alpha-helical protein [Deltaproteobacteria bacterium]